MTHSAAGLLSSSHPQSLASHLLGLQGPQQTPACKASSKLEYLNVCCCAPTPGGSNLNHKGVRVHTCVPAFDAKVGTACKAWFFGEICQVYEWPATTLWLGVRGSSLTQEKKTHVKTVRVDIPFSLVWLSLIYRSELFRQTSVSSSCKSNHTSCSNTGVCSHKSMLQGRMDLRLSLTTIWKRFGQMSHWEIENGSINFVPCNLVTTGCKPWKMD